MPKKSEAKWDEDAAKAAVLASRGESQDSTARLLRTSQASVSRLLKRAREKDWLRNKPTCTFTAERVRELDLMIYADGLVEKLRALQPAGKRHLNDVRIFDIGEHAREHDTDSYHERLTVLGERAAEYFIDELLDRVRSVGITWGATLRYLVAALTSRLSEPPYADEPIQFLPVCGDPPDAMTQALRSSSTLVAHLDECLNGRSVNSLNFSGVVASIPPEFQGERLETIQSFFRVIPGYRAVFGADGQKGKIAEVDAIVTSIGSHAALEDPWVKASAEAAGVPPEDMAELIYGNIGGLFLERPEIGARGEKILKGIKARWTGIKLAHFEKCAKAARDDRQVGVVIVASGNKSAIVKECVRLGLASRLVIDQELAAALASSLV